jgi:nitrate reductase beta subunit
LSHGPDPSASHTASTTCQDGLAQLWTDRHGTDAMFFALIRRV